MRLFHHGAQGAPSASGRPAAGRTVALLASSLALVGLLAVPATASASSKKVVVVVGPVGSQTSDYRDSARRYADYARSLGASVTEIYSPRATWRRVKRALQGANLLIYLGHGNGWPSPYYPFNPYTKDGLGLNASADNGNSNTKYYGEYYLDTKVQMATNAVVILNRLCYASGNNEWGSGYPTRKTARKRVDNFGYGFLHAGAKAVFATAIDSVHHVIHDLFRTNRTMRRIFRTDPAYNGNWVGSFDSGRTGWARGMLDPSHHDHFYHSLVGKLGMTAADWR
ncbi:MAG TPA: hypothetical protein VFS32_13275 [Candidatus Limnocylindrales bacterium]|nr:hypothetical protein [Candidatus Limnocylindrales bacterium]